MPVQMWQFEENFTCEHQIATPSLKAYLTGEIVLHENRLQTSFLLRLTLL